jgi:hypothetical protein
MTYDLEFLQNSDETDEGSIQDNSEWGSGGNPNRNLRANVLLISKNDSSGTRSYLVFTNSDYLSKLVWTFTHSQDGWHQATLLVFGIWSGATEYLDSNRNAVYYTPTNKFYKCKVTHTNIAPDSGSGATYWEEITDFTAIQQGFTNVDVADLDFNVKARTELALLDIADEEIDNNFTQLQQPESATRILNLVSALEGAESKMLSGEPDKCETIMRSIESSIEE